MVYFVLRNLLRYQYMAENSEVKHKKQQVLIQDASRPCVFPCSGYYDIINCKM